MVLLLTKFGAVEVLAATAIPATNTLAESLAYRLKILLLLTDKPTVPEALPTPIPIKAPLVALLLEAMFLIILLFT